ncbi:calcium-binding protein [Sphingomonas gei]|nr:calcium-binding protein [Sphingomonas gei]
MPPTWSNLTFTGVGAFAGTGNSGNNVVTGGSGGDVLDGRAGDDMLIGGDGNDRLTGGAGADVLSGGAGDDIADYSASAVAVTVDLTTGIVSGGDAAGDTLISIEKVIGSNLADNLSSATSGHVLQGGAGNDVYMIGDVGVSITEFGGEGTDEVRTDLASFALADAANVENLVFTGTGDFAGTGNGGNNFIVGGSGDDTIDGQAGDDILTGGIGNDFLFGGDGDDMLSFAGTGFAFGGEGSDVYDIAAASGIVYVNETGLYGIDTVLLNAQDASDVEFFRVGDDLHFTNKADMSDGVQNAGVVLTDWFDGAANVETFVTADGLHFLI